jgi:AcrR family transcriptional regulator
MARSRGDMNRRAEIIQAGFELFSERGYRGASLADVADRVGLTNAGLLHYFSSKAELLTVVLAERDRVGAQLIGEAGAAEVSLHAHLERLRALVAYNAQQAGLVQAFTVLAAESVTDGHPAQEFFRARYDRIRHRLAEDFRQDPDRRLTEPDALLAANLVIAVMDGLQVQWLLDPSIDMEASFAVVERLLERLGRE